MRPHQHNPKVNLVASHLRRGSFNKSMSKHVGGVDV